MNKFFSKYIYTILFFTFLILSLFAGEINITTKSHERIVTSFNNKLIKKEQIANRWIDSVLFNSSKNFTNWNNEHNKDLQLLYEQEGISFYKYINGDLQFWSNNSTIVKKDTLWTNLNFTTLENAYVEICKKTSDSVTVVALIKIKNNFPYENTFIKNDFHPSFKIKTPLNIELNKNNNENAIFNNKGAYLFSLNSNKILPQNNQFRIGYLFLLLSCIFLILAAQKSIRNSSFKKHRFALFAITIIVIRLGIQYFKLPCIMYSLDLFKPHYLAFSNIFSSLGELLITSVTILYLTFIFYLRVPDSNLSPNQKTKTLTRIFLWIFIVLAYGIFTFYIFEHLVEDSNFQNEAFEILNLRAYSFIGYFIIAIYFISFILIFDKACLQLKSVVSAKKMFFVILIVSLVVTITVILFFSVKQTIPILFYAAALFYWTLIRYKKAPRLSSFIFLIAIFATFTTYFIHTKNFEKRIDESKVIALSLAREQDPVAEVILSEAIQNIASDTSIIKQLSSEVFDFNKFSLYLNKNYFSGYLGRYSFQASICHEYDSLSIDNQDIVHCYNFFDNLIDDYGIELETSGLYFLKTNRGEINYFIKTPITLQNGWDNVTLFIELSSKPNFEVLGYPELLLEKTLKRNELQTEANYAKYINNKLVNHKGDFPYSLNRAAYNFTDSEFAFFQSEGFDHTIYNPDKKNTVIVSFPTISFYNIIISFSYIFLFLIIQIGVLLAIVNSSTNFVDLKLSIKNKMIYSMIFILLISLLLVGGGTLFFTHKQFENNQFTLLREKTQSVLVELEHKLSYAKEINQFNPDYLNSLLVKFSNVFYSDINLYDLNGNLVGTSRGEIFDKHLTSSRINSNAYRELILNKKARIMQKEKIGELEYYSAYIPFTSNENKLLAYLNLPYFSKEKVLRQQLMNVIVTIINIYVFLIILSIGFAVYISNKLTKPLRLVQQRIKNINLGAVNERIDYYGKDEIAELVVEYNRMLEEIDKSTKLLAKSERESAWREMARQIAHEIKNPLTPMKLSIQLLQRSWEDKDRDFDDRLNRSSKTLIQQIDSLSSIASSFSDFAKNTSSNKLTKVSILERVEQSVELFIKQDPNKITIEKTNLSNEFVKADKERLLQVFNNLIKNALHSISKEKDGNIKISFKEVDKNIVVAIKDNGTGVPKNMANKLFEPYFTTKSSGTGLGLAIVKNIVEEFNGKIHFENNTYRGTTFYVSMPIFNNET